MDAALRGRPIADANDATAALKVRCGTRPNPLGGTLRFGANHRVDQCIPHQHGVAARRVIDQRFTEEDVGIPEADEAFAVDVPVADAWRRHALTVS